MLMVTGLAMENVASRAMPVAWGVALVMSSLGWFVWFMGVSGEQ